eukprot:INCI16185.3.p1 GENE.INCI16185.3~~INCI16185.3.p1  ORF type:complete len:380 (-),score=52.46 INCI16185.3:128-1267(-)
MRKAIRYSAVVGAEPRRRNNPERARDGGHRVPHGAPAPRSLWERGPSLVYEPVLSILSPYVQRLFIPLHKDAETNQFLEKYCRGEPAWRYLMTTALRQCMSLTDTNAILGRGQMFVASTAHLHHILERSAKPLPPIAISFANPRGGSIGGGGGGGAASASREGSNNHAATGPATTSLKFRTLLDIGAGDGTVTSKYIPLLEDLPPVEPDGGSWLGKFSVGTISEYLGLKKKPGKAEASVSEEDCVRDLRDRVVATEASRSMCGRLRRRGFTGMQTCDLDDVIAKYPDGFDLVSCLNVMDRADKPLTMLGQMRQLLRGPTSRLILAVVLPFCPFVEDGTRQRQPSEKLNMKGGRCREGASFEAAVQAIIRQVLEVQWAHG